jgi:hypothetical protein
MRQILKCTDPEKMMKLSQMLINSGDKELQELGEEVQERALLIGIKHVDHIINHFSFLIR